MEHTSLSSFSICLMIISISLTIISILFPTMVPTGSSVVSMRTPQMNSSVIQLLIAQCLKHYIYQEFPHLWSYYIYDFLSTFYYIFRYQVKFGHHFSNVFSVLMILYHTWFTLVILFNNNVWTSKQLSQKVPLNLLINKYLVDLIKARIKVLQKLVV